MFGLGAWEIAMIVGALAFVAGPTLLPRLGRYLGRSVKELQEGAESFQANLHEEMDREGETKNQLSQGSTEEAADVSLKLPPKDASAS